MSSLFSTHWLIDITHGAVHNRNAAPHGFDRIVTDSRKVRAGDFFVALKGENFNGHAFIDKAIAAGAAGILCSEASPALAGVFHIAVRDTLTSYRELAGAWRAKFNLPVVAIAGSVGKTTTKELAAACLSGHFENILRTEGSQNGFLGIAMTLLELRTGHDAAVIEIGIDEPGAMAQHMPLVVPSVGIVTALAPEHMEKLRDMPTVAREEMLCLEEIMGRGGKGVVNADDSWSARHSEKWTGALRFSLQPTAGDAQAWGSAEQVAGVLTRGKLQVFGMDFAGETVEPPLPGDHNARNLLGALCLGRALGVSPAELIRGLRNFRAAAGRSIVETLPNDVLVLCDFYNASPASVEAGLKVLAKLHAEGKRSGRLIACLGDMLELGTEELRYHEDLRAPLMHEKFATVLLYGPRMRALQKALPSAKLFDTHEAMAKALKENLQAGDSIIIKGSHGMAMEKLWNLLKT